MSGLKGFKIDHLGIAVRSLDEALRFYRDQHGLGEIGGVVQVEGIEPGERDRRSRHAASVDLRQRNG